MIILGAALFNWRVMYTDKPSLRTHAHTPLVQSWHALRSRPILIWIMFAAMAFRLVTPFNHCWAPFIEGRAGERGLDWTWTMILLTLGLTGQSMRRAGSSLKASAVSLSVSLLLAGVGLVAVGNVSGVILPLCFIAVHEVGRGLFLPLLRVFTQEHIDSSYRATFVSLQSFFAQIFGVLVLTAVWFFSRGAPQNEHMIVTAWLVSGGLLALGAITLLLLRPRD